MTTCKKKQQQEAQKRQLINSGYQQLSTQLRITTADKLILQLINWESLLNKRYQHRCRRNALHWLLQTNSHPSHAKGPNGKPPVTWGSSEMLGLQCYDYALVKTTMWCSLIFNDGSAVQWWLYWWLNHGSTGDWWSNDGYLVVQWWLLLVVQWWLYWWSNDDYTGG